MKKVVVLGASANPLRFSNKAVTNLKQRSYEVFPVGLRKGKIGALEIMTGNPEVNDIDIILLYINPEIQKKYYNYIMKINPRRIIFNPGTENTFLIDLAKKNGIEVVVDCTLVMLRSGYF